MPLTRGRSSGVRPRGWAACGGSRSPPDAVSADHSANPQPHQERAGVTDWSVCAGVASIGMPDSTMSLCALPVRFVTGTGGSARGGAQCFVLHFQQESRDFLTRALTVQQ
jgi:hypothetical protein